MLRRAAPHAQIQGLSTDASKLDALRLTVAQRARGRGRRRLVLLALGVAAALGIAFLARRLAAPAVEVAEITLLSPVEMQTKLVGTGYVVSRLASTVAPIRPGRLVALYVDEGDQVTEGQVVGRMEVQEEEAALLEARAAARAAEADVRRWRAVEAEARADLARQRRLLAGGAGTKANVESAEAELRAARAQRAAAQAQVAAAQARIRSAEVALDQRRLRAPFAGTVTRKVADVGDVVTPGLQGGSGPSGVVEVADLTALEAEVEVSESQLAQVKLDDPAAVSVDAEPGKYWPAQVVSMRPSSDRSRAAVPVRVRFVGEQPPLAAPDMGARVSFLVRPMTLEEMNGPPAPSVPEGAIVQRNGRPVVLVVEKNRVRAVPVAVGAKSNGRVALTEGPPPGARVVQNPPARLDGGERVRVKERAG